MDCKHYLVGGTWMTEDTLKMKLKDGLLQDYVTDGMVKPTANVKPIQLTEEEKQQSEQIKSLFKAPEPEVKTEQPVAEKKPVKKTAKPKAEVKQEQTTPEPTAETKQPNPIQLGEKLKDSKGMEFTVSQVDPMNKTFKAKHPGTKKEVDFAIRENKKTGEFYAAQVSGPTELKIPDYVPERQVNEHDRKVKFSDSKVSEASQAIADKMSWKPKDLLGKWTNARLSGYEPITIFPSKGETVKTSKTITSTNAEGEITSTEVINSEIDTKEEPYTFKTLGDYMTHLIGEGKMTMQEAKDIQEFLAVKEKQLTENNKAAEKAIKKENTLKSSILAAYYLIPENIREAFERRVNNLVVNAKYKIRDAIREARKDTIDNYTKLGELTDAQLAELELDLEKVIAQQEKIEGEKTYGQGAGLGSRNAFNFYEGFEKEAEQESDNGNTYSDKQLFQDAIEHLQDEGNRKAVSDFITARAVDAEAGKYVLLQPNEVARVAVYKKYISDKIKESADKYHEAKKQMTNEEAHELWKDYEEKNKEWEREDKNIALISAATRRATSSSFRLFDYLVSDDFDFGRQVRLEEKLLNRTLTVDERKELVNIQAKYNQLQKEKAELEKKLSEAETNEGVSSAIEKLKKELEESKKNQGTGQEGSGTTGQVGSGTTGIVGDGSTGMSGDGNGKTKPTVDKNDKLNLTKDYIMQFIEKGITEPEDLVTAIKSNLESEHGIVRTDREIADLISGYGEKTFTSLDELDKAFLRAKAILRSKSKIEDAENKKRPFPQSGEQREITPREKELKDELKGLLDRMELTPEEQAGIDAKKLDQVKKTLGERIRKYKATNKQIYDLDIPSVINKDKDLLGNDKPEHFLTNEQSNGNNFGEVSLAVQNGNYVDAIKAKAISASDVMKILKSYNITPTTNIRALHKAEVDMARKTFKMPEPVKKRLYLDDEITQKKIELEQIKDDSQYRLEKIKKAQYSDTKKFTEAILNAFSIPKGLKAMVDLSAPYRQGWVRIVSAIPRELLGKNEGAVKREIQSFGLMHKFAWKPELLDLYIAEQKANNPLWGLMMESKLEITDSTKQEEEYFGTQMLNSVPLFGEKLNFGRYVKGVTSSKNRGLNLLKRSEAAYSGYLNLQRINAFTDAYNMLSLDPTFDIRTKEGITTLKGVSQAINTMTGRGKSNVFANKELAGIMSRVFFSTKLMASRRRMISFGLDVPKGAARRYAQKEILYYMAGQASIIGLVTGAIAIGVGGSSEDETDAKKAARKGTFDKQYIGNKNLGISFNPTSSVFGQLKIGDTFIDLSGGIFMLPRAIARLVTEEKVTQSGRAINYNTPGDNEIWATPFIDYFVNKTAPITHQTIDFLQRKNTGEKLDKKQLAIDLTMPLFIESFMTNMDNPIYEEGSTQQKILGTALNLMSFYGFSVQEPDKKDNSLTQKDKREYLLEQLRQGNPTAISSQKQNEILKGKAEPKTAEQKQEDKAYNLERNKALRKMGINTTVRRKARSSSEFGNDFKSDFGNDFKSDF